LSLVDEGAGVALVPTSMQRAQLAGVVFKPLAQAPSISQVLVWLSANRNPCLARFLERVDQAPNKNGLHGVAVQAADAR
jgi:DNA-binding transcriptional LysR family regulator